MSEDLPRLHLAKAKRRSTMPYFCAVLQTHRRLTAQRLQNIARYHSAPSSNLWYEIGTAIRTSSPSQRPFESRLWRFASHQATDHNISPRDQLQHQCAAYKTSSARNQMLVRHSSSPLALVIGPKRVLPFSFVDHS